MQQVIRTIPPEFRTFKTIDFPESQKYILNNNVPLYAVDAGTQDLVKIDFIFDAGNCYQSMSLQAGYTGSMLTEGTAKYTASQIAEKFDFYGAYAIADGDKHFGMLTLYTLNKFLEPTLELIFEILQNPSFPKKEFDTMVQKRRQSFIVEMSKVEEMARRKLKEILFGAKHPYGENSNLEDFDNTELHSSLQTFFKKNYSLPRCKIIASGKISPKMVDLLNVHLSGGDWNMSNYKSEINFDIHPDTQRHHFIEKPDAMQSAIRMGCMAVNRMHPDYFGLQVLNTILGGYFGSRLMANIREDKGFTYGIDSSLISKKEAGYILISTNVGTQYYSDALIEIYKEIDLLRNEPVAEDELTLVKNYFLADMLRWFDGAIPLGERQRTIIENGLDHNYYQRYFDEVKNTSSERLMELANKYLQYDSIYEVVAGGKA